MRSPCARNDLFLRLPPTKSRVRGRLSELRFRKIRNTRGRARSVKFGGLFHVGKFARFTIGFTSNARWITRVRIVNEGRTHCALLVLSRRVAGIQERGVLPISPGTK